LKVCALTADQLHELTQVAKHYLGIGAKLGLHDRAIDH
jgi:hypothetical protein